ncbi:MAG: hypothetical protein BMS9Abin06_0508 [Gammaproteobacteria bacterium]|nr:MAG: hypothetical protein BMS9Abin06_0508 [Gammaproteobacteria bacterium]
MCWYWSVCNKQRCEESIMKNLARICCDTSLDWQGWIQAESLTEMPYETAHH